MSYIKRKQDFRDYLFYRLDDFIEFIWIEAFTSMDPNDLMSSYFSFCKNALNIDLYLKSKDEDNW